MSLYLCLSVGKFPGWSQFYRSKDKDAQTLCEGSLRPADAIEQQQDVTTVITEVRAAQWRGG